MTDPRTPVHEIESDGRTVWVNGSDGMCIGRFSKFGVDVHTTTEAQLGGAPQCLACIHGLAPRDSWWAFRNAMIRFYGIRVGDEHTPDFVKAVPPEPMYTVYGKENLDHFGWDLFMDEPRTSYPGWVAGTFGLWESWYLRKLERDKTPVPENYQETIKSLLTPGLNGRIC